VVLVSRPSFRGLASCYTSALIAILGAEDEANDMAHAIERAQIKKVSAANYLEIAVVIDASRSEHRRLLRVRAREVHWSSAAVQGKGLQSHRHHTGSAVRARRGLRL